MKILKTLESRSNNTCELCSNKENLSVFTVEPIQNHDADDHILICETCKIQIEDIDKMDANHWRCLIDSIWSEFDAVKVVSWRMLQRLRNENWTLELLNMMYLEDDILEWANSGLKENDQEESLIHKDSNGVTLESGDSVVLIKDLKVKGTSFVAKRGAAVRRISLVHDNHEHIEGKVEGQQIVILTKFVKKT